jgi:hypothetical protein
VWFGAKPLKPKVKDTPAPRYTDEGVLIMSVYDFLLDEDSLDLKAI